MGKKWRTISCLCVYLQDGSVEEESQQLNQIIVDITIFLLHTNDVWRVIGFILIYLVLVKREEAKLEEVLDDDGDLELKKKNWVFELLRGQSDRQQNTRDSTSV